MENYRDEKSIKLSMLILSVLITVHKLYHPLLHTLLSLSLHCILFNHSSDVITAWRLHSAPRAQRLKGIFLPAFVILSVQSTRHSIRSDQSARKRSKHYLIKITLSLVCCLRDIVALVCLNGLVSNFLSHGNWSWLPERCSISRRR